ncbi:Sua5/YciO/YrdC/YwlC family protein [Salmonella enterica subsp. enterica]|nr:Sua5/YciO/YrdC/YwlC family protein [Salmonella enterica subsp. enterica]
MERICRIRHLPDGHNFTLIKPRFVRVVDLPLRRQRGIGLMKNNTPGNYTFYPEGDKRVCRAVCCRKSVTIGLRVPSNPIALALLDTL